MMSSNGGSLFEAGRESRHRVKVRVQGGRRVEQTESQCNGVEVRPAAELPTRSFLPGASVNEEPSADGER
jgi:hypothetical protein